MDKKYHNSIEQYTTENIINTYGSPIVKKKYNQSHSKQSETIIKDESSADQKKQRKEKIIGRIKSAASNFSGLFGSIIIILVAVSLIRVLYDGIGTLPTFQSLLDLFSKVEPVSTNVKNFVQQQQIMGEWVILDGLRVLLNSIINVISIVVWMASSLIDVVQFIAYFLAWIFI